MKKYILSVLLLSTLVCGKAHAQWVVTDPTNFAGNIANTVKEIATAGKTVKNTLNGFKEVEKLYNDTKKYYDALRKVNNLIGDAYKVKECILMVGDISDIYVTSYKQMLHDPHRLYKEVWIGLGGMQSAVYATEVSLEEYLTYTTEETEKVEVLRLAEQLGGDIEAAIRQLAREKRHEE